MRFFRKQLGSSVQDSVIIKVSKTEVRYPVGGYYYYNEENELEEFAFDDYRNEGDVVFDFDGTHITIDSSFEKEGYVEYWDGSNYKVLILSSQEETFCEELDLPEDLFEQAEFIGSYESNRGTLKVKLYYWNGLVVRDNDSAHPGLDSIELVEDKDEIDAIFVEYNRSAIMELRPEIINEYGHPGSLEVYRIEEFDGIDTTVKKKVFNVGLLKEKASVNNGNTGYNLYSLGELTIKEEWSRYQGDFNGYILQ